MPCLSEAVDDKLTLSKFYDFCRIEKETKYIQGTRDFLVVAFAPERCLYRMRMTIVPLIGFSLEYYYIL